MTRRTGRHLAPKMRRVSRGWVVPLSLTMMLLFGTVALASEVDVTSVVDVTAPTGSVTLAPGGTGEITINIRVTGNQEGTATFKVNRDWTLNGGVFTGSNPETFTVAPQPGGTTTNLSATGTVSVAAGQATGTFTLTVGAFDVTNSNTQGAKLAARDTANYQVTVSGPPPPPVDTTPPIISYELDPATPDGDNGWYRSDVTLAWTVTENESPDSLEITDCIDQNITADQSATEYSCSATSDGGSAGPVSVSIKRDATAPDVSLVGGPADGASYVFGSVPAEPTCTASDATSGLDGTCAVTGYSTAVGEHTVEATAKDNAGNEGSDAATYTVLAWTLSGFYSPVDMTPQGGPIVFNTVKGGSTVPLKFEVFAGQTELTSTSQIAGFASVRIPCGVAGTDEAVEFTTTGGTSLRYDSTAGQFVQNWQTPKKPGECYKVTVTTLDGSTISAYFKLK